MKKLVLNSFTVLSILFFIGCNSSDSSSSGESGSTNKVAVSTCSSGYTDIQSGDTLYQENSDTTVSIKYYSDGSQKVCSSSGRAYISR